MIAGDSTDSTEQVYALFLQPLDLVGGFFYQRICS
jgi:hypothetical protein